MNVNFEKTDDVNGVLTVRITPADYQDDFTKELKKLGVRRPLKGFRPGHVPMGLLQKFYGPAVKGDLIDRLLNNAVSDYVRDEELDILGQPMLVNDKSVAGLDDDEMEFKFDIGLAPQIDLTVDESVTIPFYKIRVTDEMVQRQSDAYRKRFGKQVPGDVAEEDSLIHGSLVELDEAGQEKPEGLRVEKSVVMPSRFADEEQKQRLSGATVGQEIVFNPHAAVAGSEYLLSTMLNIEREQAADMTSDFRLKIDEIIVNQPAELDQEYFDNVFGKDTVHTEQEYFAELKESIEAQNLGESNYRFTLDAEQELRRMAGELTLPDQMLKRQLKLNNKELTDEQVDQEYPAAKRSLEWQLIQNRVAKALGVKLEDEDVRRYSRFMAAQQFAQYGMGNLSDDIIDNYAQRLLDDERSRGQIVDRAFADKFFAALKQAVTLDEKEVSVEEFGQLFAPAEGE